MVGIQMGNESEYNDKRKRSRVQKPVSKPLPQCCYLNRGGKRCRKRSAIKHRVHLDGVIYSDYNFANWMEVNLCVEHFIAFGGSFNKKK